MSGKKFFDVNDNFEKIIAEHIKGKNEIAQIKTGWTNFVFRVLTRKGNYIFRFPRNDFFSDVIVKEFEFNKFIKNKITFEVPSLSLHFHKGRPYSLHKEIEGEMLESCYPKLTNEEKIEVAKDIVELLSQLQEIDLNEFSNVEFEILSSFLDNLSYVSQNGYDLSKHDCLKNLEKIEMSICHGDLNSGNLILKDNRLHAVIDFAFAGVSNKLCDLARIIGRTPSEFRPMLTRAYEEKFGIKLDEKAIDDLEELWKYVEQQYILYIKQNHPTIKLPTLV